MPQTAPDFQQYPVLVVDDEPDNLDVFRLSFRRLHPLLFAGGGAEALEILRAQPVAVVVTDQRMPGMSGLELLREARRVRPDTVNILVTGYADVPTLGEAINDGLIHRFLSKPWASEDVALALRAAVETHHLVQENRRLVEQLRGVNAYLTDEAHASYNFGDIVGDSAALRTLLAVVEKVAPTDSTVLLRGETGTGKELVARALHLSSPRAEGPFVRVNCAALSAGVLESELFGHEKGAFTGAVQRRVGRFELADGGTLFVDEVGDIPPETQVKLLRVLQEREIERVGGTETIKVDLRIVGATHRDLEALVAAGTFREDLYYRLNVFPVRVPPLREREGDVEKLAAHFAARIAARTGRRFAGFHAEALERLRRWTWPGNVRELENVVERALILSSDGYISPDGLDFGSRPAGAAAASDAVALVPAGSPSTLAEELDGLERSRLAAALEKHRGCKSDIAKELGVNRSTLYYRLRKYGFA